MIVNHLDLCFSGHGVSSTQSRSDAASSFPLNRKLGSGAPADPRSWRGARAAAESVYVVPAQEIATETASLDSVMSYRNNPVRDRQHLSVCDF
jgi:hypothetical protein